MEYLWNPFFHDPFNIWIVFDYKWATLQLGHTLMNNATVFSCIGVLSVITYQRYVQIKKCKADNKHDETWAVTEQNTLHALIEEVKEKVLKSTEEQKLFQVYVQYTLIELNIKQKETLADLKRKQDETFVDLKGKQADQFADLKSKLDETIAEKQKKQDELLAKYKKNQKETSAEITDQEKKKLTKSFPRFRCTSFTEKTLAQNLRQKGRFFVRYY